MRYIREYESADREAALSVYLETFTSPPFSYEWMERDKIHSYFEDTENTPKFKGYLLYESDDASSQSEKLIGICFGTIGDYFLSTSYDIREIMVLPSAQGKGSGTDFMRRLEKKLAKLGVKYINITTQRTIPAFGFYKKTGFVVSEDTVTMTKFL